MLKCREVTHLVASGTDVDGPLIRRLEIRLHLMMCGHCKNYMRQVRSIAAAARRLWGLPAEDPAEVAGLVTSVLAAVRPVGGPASGDDGRPGDPPLN